MSNCFTCIGKGHGAPVIPATREDWEKLRNEKWLADMCQRIAAGDEKLKSRLPIWTPSCAAFKDNHRAIADAQQPLPRLMLDFDEKGHSAEIMEKAMQLQEAGKWEILLVEESVRMGTHVLITLPKWMLPQEAQTRFSNDIGFQADPALKDIARCIYMVPMKNTLYINENLFLSPQSNTEEKELRETPCHSEVKNKENNLCHSVVKESYPQAFKGTPYATIIDRWFALTGGEPQPGERNAKLHRLATHLRYITDNNEEHLLQIIPNYGLDNEEMKSLIHSACTSKFCGMPQMMKRVLGEVEGGAPEAIETELPPTMPEVLPPLIELLVSKTPAIYKPAVDHAVFPALGAHLWKTYFRYIDNVAHEATLMNVLMAGTGAGKNCITEPINRILMDIRRRDRENMFREKAWKKEMQATGANKNKRQRPEGLVIQEIDPDMTNAAFVQRLADAEGKFLYTKMNEIDQFDALRTSSNRKSQFQIMCLAFDPGNVYGQTRIGTGSVTERVCIRFNWNASTTIQKGQAYFRSVLTDGPVSRINFCTIPEREIGSPMPVYGSYTDEFDRELAPYIEQLNAAHGEVYCPEAYALAQILSEECAEFARLSQSRVYENLSFRANVIAFLKACILYVAHGQVWDETMEEFVRWSLHYDMWCKMHFFGREIEGAEHGEANTKNKGPRNLLDLLPDEFTVEEAKLMRQREGIQRGTVSDMLNNWKKRKYIVPKEGDGETDRALQRFVKTESYLKNHPSVGQ